MSFETGSGEPSRVELLELDIDVRLAGIWQALGQSAISNNGSFSLEEVAQYMRAAYGQGYCDVLHEQPDNRGSLCIDHGYRVPSSEASPTREDFR